MLAQHCRDIRLAPGKDDTGRVPSGIVGRILDERLERRGIGVNRRRGDDVTGRTGDDARGHM